MNLATALAVLTLVIGVPLSAYAVARLWHVSFSQRNPVVRERAITETIVLFTAIVFGIIFLFNDKILLIPFLDSEGTKISTRAAVLVLSVVPALYWLFLYRNTKT